MTAARAEANPVMESSNARVSPAATPSIAHARWYMSGAGLGCSTSSAAMLTGNVRVKPPLARAASSSDRGELLATAIGTPLWGTRSTMAWAPAIASAFAPTTSATRTSSSSAMFSAPPGSPNNSASEPAAAASDLPMTSAFCSSPNGSRRRTS